MTAKNKIWYKVNRKSTLKSVFSCIPHLKIAHLKPHLTLNWLTDQNSKTQRPCNTDLSPQNYKFSFAFHFFEPWYFKSTIYDSLQYNPTTLTLKFSETNKTNGICHISCFQLTVNFLYFLFPSSKSCFKASSTLPAIKICL